jgi:hypothetical protein
LALPFFFTDAKDYRWKWFIKRGMLQITTSAYYRELGLGMKKKKHGQLLSVKDMFK